MDREEQRNLIADPAWEQSLRAKARETIAGLTTMGISVPSAAFDVDGVPVVLTWTPREIRIDAGDDVYTWRLPLAWVTAPA